MSCRHSPVSFLQLSRPLWAMKILLQLLAILRAIHWAHWTAHWKMKGEPFYGDHLLFDKLYTALGDEVDTLAEKIVGMYGADAIQDMVVLNDAARFMAVHEVRSSGDLYRRALGMEDHLQKAIRLAYDSLKARGDMSLGMDDFLMSMANAHETHQYLLRQRLDSSPD